ncbi:MAG: GNVR domain-containing protein [Fidelibacterota bacterium]
MIAPEEQTGAAIDIASQLKSQIMADEVKIQILKETLPANHPDLLNLYREKTLLSKQLKDLNEGGSNDFLLPKFSKIPDLGLEYARLTRQIEVQNQIFIFLTQQYEEAKIKEARDTPTLQVLDYGKLAEKKYKPSRRKIVTVAFLLALILSVYYYYFADRYSFTSQKAKY